MISANYRDKLEIIGFFIFGLILFTLGLGSQEVIGFDSRFYLFALEMWQYGPSWFPTTYHQPYPDYLATSTFLIYLVALLCGGVTKWAAVLPSAIAASITFTVTYRIGALHDKRWGFYGAMFLLLTVAFLKGARSIALDMYPAMITTLCFYLIYSAEKENKPHRAWWIYPLFLLGFAFRGPIGLVIPTGVVCAFYLLDCNFKKFFISGFLAFILLIVSTIILLALAYHVGGNVFLHDVLRMQVLGRIDNSYLPVYFYFVDGMRNYAISFPIACLALIGAGFYFKQIADRKFLLKLLGWGIIILIGMSIPGDKKTRYILPAAPALALLAAYPFVTTIQKKYFLFLRSILMWFFMWLPIIFLLIMGIVYFYAKNAEHVDIHYVSIAIAFIIMQLLAFSFFARNMMLIFIAAVSFVTIYIFVVEPIELYLERGRDFVMTVESQRLQQHAQLVFYKERPDSLPIKYLVNMPHRLPERDQVIFIDDASSLVNFAPPAFFVTSASYFEALPSNVASKFEVIAKDKLGHVDVVVFKRKLS